MTDPDLVAKKLALIETCVRELRDLAQPARIASDVREERFVERTLQIAIQASLDVASHNVSDERLGEPESHREAFQKLASAGWVPSDLLPSLMAMAGLRNVLVHGYEIVDLDIVKDIVEKRLGDLERYCTAIRSRL